MEHKVESFEGRNFFQLVNGLNSFLKENSINIIDWSWKQSSREYWYGILIYINNEPV